jgi:hypothetical protein
MEVAIRSKISKLLGSKKNSKLSNLRKHRFNKDKILLNKTKKRSFMKIKISTLER